MATARKPRKPRLDTDAAYRTRYDLRVRREVARQVREWLAMQLLASPALYRHAREVIAKTVPNSTSSWRLRTGRR